MGGNSPAITGPRSPSPPLLTASVWVLLTGRDASPSDRVEAVCSCRSNLLTADRRVSQEQHARSGSKLISPVHGVRFSEKRGNATSQRRVEYAMADDPTRTGNSNLTGFYSRNLYLILAAVAIVSGGVAAFLLLQPGKTNWKTLLNVIGLLLAIVLVLYSFVEDTKEIGSRKKFVTLCLAIGVTSLQASLGLYKDNLADKRSRISDSDQAILNHASKIVKEAQYKNSGVIEKEALPLLQPLYEKHSYNPQVLLAYGTARFSIGQFKESADIFQEFVDLFPSDFKAYYYSGISPKLLAAEREKLEKQKGSLSAAASILDLREAADRNLSHGLRLV
jgi:hypothetical protein